MKYLEDLKVLHVRAYMRFLMVALSLLSQSSSSPYRSSPPYVLPSQRRHAPKGSRSFLHTYDSCGTGFPPYEHRRPDIHVLEHGVGNM